MNKIKMTLVAAVAFASCCFAAPHGGFGGHRGGPGFAGPGRGPAPMHHHSHALHGRDYGAIGLGFGLGVISSIFAPPPPPPVVVAPAPVVTQPVVVTPTPVVAQPVVTAPAPVVVPAPAIAAPPPPARPVIIRPAIAR